MLRLGKPPISHIMFVNAVAFASKHLVLAPTPWRVWQAIAQLSGGEGRAREVRECLALGVSESLRHPEIVVTWG